MEKYKLSADKLSMPSLRPWTYGIWLSLTASFAYADCVSRDPWQSFLEPLNRGATALKVVGTHALQSGQSCLSVPKPRPADLSNDFPCKLDDATQKWELVLAGENHNSLNDYDRRISWSQSAIQGDFLLGVEGIPLGKTDPEIRHMFSTAEALKKSWDHLQGFEDPFAYAVTVFGEIAFESDRAILPQYPLLDFVARLRDSFYFQQAWDAFRKSGPLQDQRQERLAQAIDRAICLPGDTSDPALEALIARDPDFAIVSLAPFLKGFAEKFLKIIRTQNASRMTSSQWELLTAMLSAPGDLDTHKRFLYEIARDWRNESMARNISRLYCEAVAKGKDLRIIVGAAHVPGLTALIQKSSQGRIKVVTQGSTASSQAGVQ